MIFDWNLNFPYKSQPLIFSSRDKAIPLVVSSSTINLWDESVKAQGVPDFSLDIETNIFKRKNLNSCFSWLRLSETINYELKIFRHKISIYLIYKKPSDVLHLQIIPGIQIWWNGLKLIRKDLDKSRSLLKIFRTITPLFVFKSLIWI